MALIRSLFRTALPTLLVLAVLGASTQALADSQCSNCQSWTCQTVSLTIQVPNQPPVVMSNVPYIKGMNVRLAMYNAAVSFESTNYCPYGGFVTTINGYTPTGNDYWSLSINGKTSDTGMDTTVLNPKDQITWSIQTFSGAEVVAAAANTKAAKLAKNTKSKSHQHELFRLHQEKAGKAP